MRAKGRVRSRLRAMPLGRPGPAMLVGWALALACSIQGRDDDDGGRRAPGPTEACESSCLAAYPTGEAAYRALRECQLCRACADLCAPTVGNACVPQPDFDGCSSAFPSCEACIASACALEQKPDTSFVGTCAPEAEGCLSVEGCLALNNCVARCVADAPGAGGGASGMSTSSGAGGGTIGPGT
jgi:hypothetical protein